ncbi:hypothetical protein L596_003527 [Steinernema carpocapsae]|uniref:SH3 domain-containing protein n=1 Tax=Steinernema carpocapsae TaxID=34508 RepID=A0A4U8UW10_STECR|nr:hypothetical protein L596_003527 [Steinernema carpocapsae]
MTKGQNGKRLSFFVRDAKSPSLASEENVEENVECNKVVYGIHKQLVTQFHPAVKEVAEAGVNLLRAFHGIHKATDAYTNTLLALAVSGSKSHPETVEVAGDLHQLALQMRAINEANRKCIGKLSSIVTKTNEYSIQEKELLKHLLTSFTKKEKGIKKFVEKGLRDPCDLQEFYRAEMKDNVQQQKFRYKFFLDKHKEWLLTFNDVFRVMNDFFHHSDSESESESESLSDKEEEQPAHRQRPFARSVSAASSHRSHGSHNPQKSQEWSRRESIGNSSISVSEQDVRVSNNEKNGQELLQLRKNNSGLLLPQPRDETKSRTSSILKVREHPQMVRNSESSITDTIMDHERDQVGDDEVDGILLDLDNATASHSTEEPIIVLHENIETVQVDVHNNFEEEVEEFVVPQITEEHVAENLLVDKPAEAAPIEVAVVPIVTPRKIENISVAPLVPTARNAPTKTAAPKPVENNPIKANSQSSAIADAAPVTNKTLPPLSTITPLSPTVLQYSSPQLTANPNLTAAKLTKPLVTDARSASWERGDLLVCTSNYAASGSDRCLSAKDGQKFELLKVGTKGWIFIRNLETLSTGWFPSIYVKKVE